MAKRYPVELTGEMNDAKRVMLDSKGLLHTGSHGGGTIAQGGQLPEPNHHTVYIKADSHDQAAEIARAAVDDVDDIYFHKARPDADPIEV